MLIVTGYSLGGALATLSSLDLQNKYNKVSDMYNYGCPRVGDKDFAKYFNDKIKEAYRVVHNRDIVPHVPPTFLRFRHVGRKFSIMKK